MKFVKSTVAMAVLAAFGLGAAGTAQAGAYAYSYNDIFNLTTTFTCSTGGIGCISITSYQASSSADADLKPLPAPGGVSDSDTVAATTAGGTFPVTKNPDVPVQWESVTGTAPANNTWSEVGVTTYDYARGDAQIVSQQITSTPTNLVSTQVKNLAEGNLVANIDSSAVANGQNTSTTGYSVTFTTTGTWSVAFVFDALPFIEALITTPGATSTGDLDVSFTINLLEDGVSTQVFNWQPNGVVGSGITGGTETIDDATMNIELADTVLDGASAIYNPAANDTDCTAAGCNYAASSNLFGAGTYNLILTMHEGVVMTNTAVPVPAPLVLMGLGLAALGFVNRRSQKA